MKHHETVDATPRELTSTQTAAPNPPPSHQRNAAHLLARRSPEPVTDCIE